MCGPTRRRSPGWMRRRSCRCRPAPLDPSRAPPPEPPARGIFLAAYAFPSLSWFRRHSGERLYPCLCASLQRVGFVIATPDSGYGSRIDTCPLGESLLFHPVSMKQARQAIVSLDAARLGINSVLGVALQDEFLLGRPGLRPHRRILDRYDIIQPCGRGPRPALDHVQILARPLEIGLRTEIRHVDHQRIALPAPTRVAVPLANAGGQMRTAVHDDIALPSLALTYVVEHRDAAGRLHDSSKADAIGDRSKGADLRQPAHQAAHRQ